VKGKTEYKKLRINLKNGTYTSGEKAALGSVLGAMIGDSLGSYLEFKKGDIDDARVDAGMCMPGGGTWGLAPG